MAATLVSAAALGCYEMKATQLRVRTPYTQNDCVATADRVFDREGFVAAPGITGTSRVYTPVASPTTAMALRWGIAVAIDDGSGRDRWRQCTFDLQALSAEMGCGMQCPLTPQPGFDDVTRKMAGLLSQAFGGPAEAVAPRPSSAESAAPRGPSSFGLAPVNAAAEPCTDFASYACGAEASWGKLRPESDVLAWRNAAIWRFLDELAAGKHQDGTPAPALLKDFYLRCKDPRAREGGLDDLRADLARIEAAGTLADLARILGDLRSQGAQTTLAFAIARDEEHGDPTPYVGQLGLILSVRPREGAGADPRAAALRAHWQRLAALSGTVSPGEADVALEVATMLANVRAPTAAPARADGHPMIDRAALAASQFPWRQYLDALGVPAALPLRTTGPTTLARGDKLANLPLAKLKSFARLGLLEARALYLGASFSTEEGAFHRRDDAGGKAMIAEVVPACVAVTAGLLGPALAETYLPTLAREPSQKAALEMFRGLRGQLAKQVDAAPWLDPVSRRAAHAKVDAVAVRFIDDVDDGAIGLTRLLPGSLVSAIRQVASTRWRAAMARVAAGDAGARDVYASFDTADYRPQMNVIWLSPEIVRSPFLAQAARDAVSLGALGTVIGHELAHVLSPGCRHYDAGGSFRAAWSREVGAAFDARAMCVVRRLAASDSAEMARWREAADEAVADLVGVDLALRVLEGGAGLPPTENPLQAARKQFFLSYAQMTCAMGALIGGDHRSASDPHPAPRFRINNTVANLPAFADAFNCKASAPLAPLERCSFW